MTSQAGPGWELVRSFQAVMRQGSLSAAARALGLTQPTLGRHIDQLERALGTKLFMRSPHGLAATEAAHTMLPQADAMAAAAAALVRAASGAAEAVAGVVRITASDVVGAEVLPPMLAELRAAHPGLVCELVLSNRTDDLLRREADIAVRMVEPQQGALLVRRLGRIAVGLYARHDYLARCGTPRTVGELAGHALIGFDRDMRSARSLRGLPAGLDRTAFALRTDSDLAQLAALRAGFGIGGCQVPIARRDPELVPVLADVLALSLDAWLVMHEDLRASRRVRVVFEALGAALVAYVARGRDPSASGVTPPP